MVKILIGIPCFNCQVQIQRVISELDPEILQVIHKVFVIDNQSEDETVDKAVEAIQRHPTPEKFLVFRNEQNYGLGGTHKVAFQLSQKYEGHYLGILHGDNQAHAEDLLNLIKMAVKNQNPSAYLGARFMGDSKLEGYSLLREWGNRGLNSIYTLLSGRRTYDLGSGVNLFRVKDFCSEYYGFSDQFTFNMDLLLWYYKNKKSVQFVPITWSETDQISNAKTFQVGWRALKTVLNWRFKGKPIDSLSNPNRAYQTCQIFPTQ